MQCVFTCTFKNMKHDNPTEENQKKKKIDKPETSGGDNS